MRNFEAHNDKTREEMLNAIGVKGVDVLFDMIPTECRTKDLTLPLAMSEIKAQKLCKKTAGKNCVDFISFMGGGAVSKFIPSAISDVASRFEFLSAYTPYQAEISQGSLQIMYEFQSMMCELTGQDVSNASVYDGATACAEACLMAVRINKGGKIFISSGLEDNYIEVIKTYLWAQDIEFEVKSEATAGVQYAGKIFAYPDKTGELKALPQKVGKEIIIACVDLSILPVVEPPNVDITVGSYQPFGLPLNFGGAYGGFIATKDAYKRQLVGRIAGKTVDTEGNAAYVLTLQAREQHIRRSKATGNICSNQALTAVMTALYVSLIGKNGLVNFANLSYKNAHVLSKKLDEVGFKTLNEVFFNTFTIKMKSGMSAEEFLKKLKKVGILGGVQIAKDEIVITATELIDDTEIEQYVDAVKC